MLKHIIRNNLTLNELLPLLGNVLLVLGHKSLFLDSVFPLTLVIPPTGEDKLDTIIWTRPNVSGNDFTRLLIYIEFLKLILITLEQLKTAQVGNCNVTLGCISNK